jgi:hypothetical protein
VPIVARVTTDLAPTPDFEVLYEAGIGPAPDQLGLQDCNECDQTRPLRPMLTSDDRLVIADVFNGRWVTVDQGQPTTVPMPTDRVAWDALIGPGDIVYVAAFIQTPSGPAGSELLAFDAADLGTVLARSPIQSLGTGNLRFDGKDVVLSIGDLPPNAETHFPLVRPAPDTMATTALPNVVGEPPLEVTTPDGTTIAWELEPAIFGSVVPLADPDGVVALTGGFQDKDTLSWAVWTLQPDGTSAGQAVAIRPDPYNGGPSISERGIVSLERTPGGWRVVRFPLPF